MNHKTFIFLFLPLLFSSCYKDLSTEATGNIPDIFITGPDEDINITYGETLKMDIRVSQMGSTSKDFTYLWEVDLVADRKADRIELGTEKDLVYTVNNSPSDTPYTLTLTVTDTKTGYAKVKRWKLYVSNTLPEGLLVAYTRDGGETSDFDHVSASSISYGYKDENPKYTRNVFSSFNGGAKIPGRIAAMVPKVASNMAVFNDHHLIVGTDRHMYSIDPITYKIVETDGELFNNPTESSYDVQALFNFNSYVSNAMINGRMYCCYCTIDYRYAALAVNAPDDSFFTPDGIAYGIQDYSGFAAFSPSDRCFYTIMGWASFNGAMVPFEPAGASFSFAGAECLAAGCLDNRLLTFIIKDATGEYHICTLDQNNEFAYKEYDLDVEGKEMEQAVDFAFCDNTRVIYYTTASSVYSIVISGDRVVVNRQQLTVGAGEKITSVSQYMQAWYGVKRYSLGGDDTYPFQLQSNRNQLIFTTYNESTGEGRFYLKPFIVGTGNFTISDNGVYGGFGEITSITPVLK